MHATPPTQTSLLTCSFRKKSTHTRLLTNIRAYTVLGLPFAAYKVAFRVLMLMGLHAIGFGML
jgi:hypothetical protein